MRALFLLVGLTSLVTLSMAAPAPGREINVPTGVKLGKVKVCNGLREQGTCHTIKAHTPCTQLESPVRSNLQSLVEEKGNMCAYHQGDSCEKLAFIVDSSDSTQTVDVSPKRSPALTNVFCLPGSAGVDSASASASLSTSIDDPISLLKSDTSKPETLARQIPNPALGDALICSLDVRSGPCFKVLASGTCADLPANVDRKARTVYQNRGSYCEYFKTDDCHDRLGYSDSTKESKRITVPERIGNQIGSAYCIRSSLAVESAGVEVEGWSEDVLEI